MKKYFSRPKMGVKLTAVSLFSGCGGFDWGVYKAGVDIIWANDIDPHAANAYKSLFPEIQFVLDDVRNIKKFPRADILIGCYPCTGFSLAARRRWKNSEKRDLFANENNFLYTEFLRALKQVRPKYLFVENVKGMASAEDGWFLKQQIKGFKEYGYKISHELLDSSGFGVAQTRKRIFIVGIRNDIFSLDYKFKEPTHGPDRKFKHVVLRDIIGHMEPWPEGEFFDYKFHGHYLTRNRKRGWNGVSYTIVANAHHVPLHPMGEPMRFIAKNTWELVGKENRRLSWRECAAIQGLPPQCIPSGTLMDKYRIIGNAVPPVFGKILIEPILEFEFSGYHPKNSGSKGESATYSF